MDAAERSGRWKADARPRLVSKVRLQWNAARNQALLLYPEGALVLNPTARAVLELCDGRRTLAEIVHELASRFDGSVREGSSLEAGNRAAQPETPAAESVALSTDPGTSEAEASGSDAEMTRSPAEATGSAAVERDVIAFLERLDQRGWVVADAG